jgi:hypothetical protein
MGLKKKDIITFLISDFIASDFERSLGMVSSLHDVVAIRCMDKNEMQFPSVGFLEIEDNETGLSAIIDTRKSNLRSINNFLEKRKEAQDAIFGKFGIDCIDVQCSKPFIGELIRFFRRRMRY